MIEQFEFIISTLIQPNEGKNAFPIFDPTEQLDEERTDQAGIAQALNAAFLIALAGSRHLAFEQARHLLDRMADSSESRSIAEFYLTGINLIHREIETICRHDPDFSNRLLALFEWLSHEENLNDTEETTGKIWSVFFPEAAGIRTNRQECVEALRTKRTITITELNDAPITDVAQQILFTSNIMLTVPPATKTPDELPLSDDLKAKLLHVTSEPQLYWYDHPIQIGVEPEKNEVLHGLYGLQESFAFERDHGNAVHDAKITCVLSVSVTHQGLQDLSKRYLEEEFARFGGLKNLNVYVFTEADTRQIIDEILAPAAERYLQSDNAKALLDVFGVDGKYGRHYSFLKAVAAFWNVFIQPEIKATFKIDLDQIFPQKELVEQTGRSAFGHLTTPLWGAYGVDENGQSLEAGMIAGALVNECDVSKSLFTPDVPFPNRALSPDEHIFFSTLPQALSTEAEIMTRYATDKLDGKRTCIQRIHVTGGTSGILVDSLRRHRPFTPSFISRAEDQAYLLSVISNPDTRLAYVHQAGLIMRHDKEAFAQEAIEAALIGKLVGDSVRILDFSEYAKVLTGDVAILKDTVDPFTGCFISRIPTTVVFLRFGLQAASLFAAGKDEQGLEFVTIGARNITKALQFVGGKNSRLKRSYEKECLGWNLYYDVLSAMEDAMRNGDSFALKLRNKAETIVDQCSVRFGPVRTGRRDPHS